MDAVVWAMEYYQEHLWGLRFILYTDHKPLETLGTLHMKALNLAMIDFDFKIRYKKEQKCQKITFTKFHENQSNLNFGY
jgi:hypothetical protein